ncbi:MAG: alpha/beta fold hydrolase [Actinobacteria bacterium]|nr:alpha/beta fold hydrolase [Actinomycetota bacterium]
MTTVPVNGFDFDVDISGPQDGEVVVLLHGFPQDRTCWRPLTERLNAAGYRTVAPDQRGYSPGARPKGVAEYRLGPLTSDVTGLLDALDIDRAHVVGHDWGGAVAWALASDAPARVRSLTVLSTPHPAAMQRAMIRSTQGLKSWYMGLFQVPHLAETLLAPSRPMWRAVMRGLPADSVARYTANVAEPGALTAMLNWYRAMPRDVVKPSLPMHRIEVPTLYIWGRRDPALGEAGALATADYVTGPYEFVILPDAGHWLPEQAVDDVSAALLDHLATYGASAAEA